MRQTFIKNLVFQTIKAMKKYIIGLILLFILLANLFAQDKPNQLSSKSLDENKIKGEEVIAQYHQAIGYRKVASAQQRLSLSEEYTFKGPNFDVSTIEEYYLSGNLLRQNSKNTKGSVNYSRSAVLNGDNYYRNYIANNFPESRRDTLTKEQQLLDDEVKLLKSKIFVTFFPITLEESWYTTVDFRYIGIAESNTEKADVLESKVGQNRTYQLLFDTKSHLLTMWKIITVGKDGKSQNRIYYFDDYKVLSGIKVATKIEVYQDDKISVVKNVKSFDANPTLSAGFFELK